MKKLVIQNLRDAFTFGLSFNDLAKIENAFLEAKDYEPTIFIDSGRLEFISASVTKNGRKTMYYKFISIF